MAGHAGLQRVVKTVKGKKGSTHRAYWVNVAKSAGTVAALSAAGGASHNIHGWAASQLAGAVAINRRMGSGAAKNLQYARQGFGTRMATDVIHVGAQIAGSAAGFVGRSMLNNSARGRLGSGITVRNAPSTSGGSGQPAYRLHAPSRQLNGHSRGGSGSNTHGF